MTDKSKRSDQANNPSNHLDRRNLLLAGTALVAAASVGSTAAVQTAQAQQQPAAAAGRPPNILVIWGDDIGFWNISHNNRGMMGYMTPNIDRIAREGLSFTDYYGQQSCTAGRAAFIGGNVPVRTGMTKVGLPGAKEGWQAEDGCDASDRHEEPGLRHRSVRQEPPGRPRLSTCRRNMVLMSSSATSIISMPRRSRRTATIRKTWSFGRSSARAACCA